MVEAWPMEVIRLAQAIKKAEGSPVEWNNPLDLTWAPLAYPSIGVANSEGVLKFPDAETGWQAGCHQVNVMLAGQSAVYKLDDDLAAVGLEYSHGDPNWAKNVASFLGVPETTTLRELANGPAQRPT